jgi:hypothetical protein
MLGLYGARMKRFLTATAAIALMSVSGCGGDQKPTAGTPTSSTPTAVTTAPSLPASTEPTVPPTTEPPPPADPKLGQTQTTTLGTATVYAVKFPVKAQDSTANDIRDKGMLFAVADIKACSNGEVNEDGYGFDASDFQLVDTESRTYEFWNVQLGAKAPNLTNSLGFGTETPRKGSCKRGWLTFQVPPKTKITAVEYNPSGGTPLVWKVG